VGSKSQNPQYTIYWIGHQDTKQSIFKYVTSNDLESVTSALAEF